MESLNKSPLNFYCSGISADPKFLLSLDRGENKKRDLLIFV